MGRRHRTTRIIAWSVKHAPGYDIESLRDSTDAKGLLPPGLSLHSCKINYPTFSRLYRNPEGIEFHSRERVSRSRLWCWWDGVACDRAMKSKTIYRHPKIELGLNAQRERTMSLPASIKLFPLVNVRQCLDVRENLHGLGEKRSNLNTPTPRTSTLLQISRVNPIPIVFREVILADDFFQLAMTLIPSGFHRCEGHTSSGIHLCIQVK